MMNCNNNWDKCADVIYRLSSRINNEQNLPAIIPSCIEKSFYQCKSGIGGERCVEVGGNGADSIQISNGYGRNTGEQSFCDTKINQQYANPITVTRHQFALSNMFDNKRKYIDYVVSNVLRQVVNHVSVDTLHRLSCCLPQRIEDVLCNVTDIDSDRLVRILVAEVLQSYGTNAGQVTDWYAFANTIKPVSPLIEKKEYADDKNINDTENQIPSQPKKLAKDKKSSDRLLSSHTKSIFATTPSSPSFMNKKQSSESIVSNQVITPLTELNITSVNRTPSTTVTPQIMSTTSRTTPMSTYSKETYAPVGTKYQSKTKPNQDVLSDHTDRIEHLESLPFHDKSSIESRLEQSQTQHRRSTNAQHHDHKLNKNSDRSSSSDCIVTIRHKHKHKRDSNHHHHHHHQTTRSFDPPSSHSSSSHSSIPDTQHVQKYQQTSADPSSITTDTLATLIHSRQNINLNSVPAEQFKSSNLFTDEQMLLFRLLTSPDKAAEYLHQLNNPAFRLLLHDEDISFTANQQQISLSMNTFEASEHSITDDHPSSTDLNKVNLLPSQSLVQLNLEKKTLRINHYPNMLADFD